jgi:hypothetical protein
VIESRTRVDGRLSCRRGFVLHWLCQGFDLRPDGVSLDPRGLARQECRTRGGQLGHGFHGAIGVHGATADDLDRAAAELGWRADPGGELDLAVVEAGDSVWVTTASREVATLAAGLARSLRRAVRLYTVETDGHALRCEGRFLRPDGGTDPIDGSVDRDVIDPSDADLVEERLRVLLDANEDIAPDRARTSRRFAVRTS